jgi:hypothetical protein
MITEYINEALKRAHYEIIEDEDLTGQVIKAINGYIRLLQRQRQAEGEK